LQQREVITVTGRRWTNSSIAERLRRDATVVEAFMSAHVSGVRASRTASELHPAAHYGRWLTGPGSEELHWTDDDDSIDEFIGRWRLHAVAADVRAMSVWAEVQIVLSLLCLSLALLEALAQDFTIAVGLAAVLLLLVLSMRWRRSVLVVGPEAPKNLPPLLSGRTALRDHGQELVFRLADGRTI
jgi:hypothetical protein